MHLREKRAPGLGPEPECLPSLLVLNVAISLVSPAKVVWLQPDSSCRCQWRAVWSSTAVTGSTTSAPFCSPEQVCIEASSLQCPFGPASRHHAISLAKFLRRSMHRKCTRQQCSGVRAPITISLATTLSLIFKRETMALCNVFNK